MNLLGGLGNIDFSGLSDNTIQSANPWPDAFNPPQDISASTSYSPTVGNSFSLFPITSAQSSGGSVPDANDGMPSVHRYDFITTPLKATLPLVGDTSLDTLNPISYFDKFVKEYNPFPSLFPAPSLIQDPSTINQSATDQTNSLTAQTYQRAGIPKNQASGTTTPLALKKAYYSAYYDYQLKNGIDSKASTASKLAANGDYAGAINALNATSQDTIFGPVFKLANQAGSAIAQAGNAVTNLVTGKNSSTKPGGGSPAKTGAAPAGQSSFASGVNSVTQAILSVLAPIAASKQAKAQQRASNPGKGGGHASGGESNLNTYLLIGGGVLAVGALVFLVSKK